MGVGDGVPVDGLLITQHEMQLDESNMTGESQLVAKHPENPYLISGTKVMEGKGAMITCAVGMDSNLGKYYRDLSGDREQTPLQEKLEDVANDIGKIGLLAALATFFILCIHLLIICIDKVKRL